METIFIRIQSPGTVDLLEISPPYQVQVIGNGGSRVIIGPEARVGIEVAEEGVGRIGCGSPWVSRADIRIVRPVDTLAFARSRKAAKFRKVRVLFARFIMYTSTRVMLTPDKTCGSPLNQFS